MFKKYRTLLLTCLILICYIGSQIFFSLKTNQNSNDLPVITFDKTQLNLSVDSTNQDLLKGVKGYDKQDGDITNNILIESQSIFIDQTTRQVNYLLFDSDDHVTKASRLITYTDYTAPTFSMNDQLRNSRYSTSEVTNIIHANSCVDGDISNNITIMDVSFATDSQLSLRISVTDSTNTTSYLNVNYYLNEESDIDIVLDDYLIYLEVGESYDYRANIINVIEKLYQDISLIDSITIDVPKMEKPGTYEVTYSIHRANGNSGITTMVVVVE